MPQIHEQALVCLFPIKFASGGYPDHPPEEKCLGYRFSTKGIWLYEYVNSVKDVRKTASYIIRLVR